MNYSWEIIKLVLYLGLILGLIYLVAYLFKNRMMPQNRSGRHIQVLEQTYITAKVCLSLVRIKEEIFLLSISDREVKVVNSWPLKEFGEITLSDNKPFREYIQDFLNKGKNYSNWNRRDDDE